MALFRGRLRVLAVLAGFALTSVMLSSCGIPVDPRGTLDRVSGAVLHAGATPATGLVTVSDGAVDGPLVDLVEGFAAARDAEVEWTIGSEEELVVGLEAGTLDVVIGGMTADTPWTDRASVTRAYPDLAGAEGADIVVLLPLGENALQAALERYLDHAARR